VERGNWMGETLFNLFLLAEEGEKLNVGGEGQRGGLQDELDVFHKVASECYVDDVKNESSDFISAFEPSKVVLVCGENDLSCGSTPAATFANYQTVVMPYT